jgi:hypothetical protein
MEQRALSALERERHVISDPRVVVAAGAAWLQTKLHSNLAEAYSVAALELSAINDRIPVQSRNGLGTVCQRIRGRDLPRAHAVASPENYEVVGACGETTTHCGRLDSTCMILAAVADEVYCVIRYDKHKVLTGSLDPRGTAVRLLLG